MTAPHHPRLNAAEQRMLAAQALREACEANPRRQSRARAVAGYAYGAFLLLASMAAFYVFGHPELADALAPYAPIGSLVIVAAYLIERRRGRA